MKHYASSKTPDTYRPDPHVPPPDQWSPMPPPPDWTWAAVPEELWTSIRPRPPGITLTWQYDATDHAHCQDCGATPADCTVYPAEEIGPRNVCRDCRRLYVDDDDLGWPRDPDGTPIDPDELDGSLIGIHDDDEDEDAETP